MQAFHFVFHDPQLPASHTFPLSKYRLLRERLEGRDGLQLAEAEAAADEQLRLVHTAAYVTAVSDGSLSAAAQREIGFPWNPLMPVRARGSVGATIAAARAALAEGVACNLGGGTHHAHADKGSGYCVFNDTAVATRVVQGEHRARAGSDQAAPLNVAVIDLDVHQGDGTAAIFDEDPTVFTLSLHGARNFPFRKTRSSLDIGSPDGCEDAAYLDALDDGLDAVWRWHAARPIGLAFYLAGADPHEGDRLGRLKISAAGLRERDRRVLAAARSRGIPVALSMAGGYGRDIDDTVAVQLNTVEEALMSWRAWRIDRIT